VKVALDVSAVPPRLAGAGRYIAELARRLPGRGVQTTLVTRRDDANRWAQWSPTSRIAPVVPVARAPRLAFEAWRLGTSAPARSADVFHAPHYTMSHRGSTPTVVTIHDLTFFTDPQWHERSKVAFFRRAINYSVRHAAVLISVSDFTARQIDELFPHHAPVVVAPHGVDLERFTTDASHDEELFRRYELPPDVPYVFFLGTVEPRKGLDVLLESFAQLSKDDSSLELWLAGQAGWGLKEFEDQLAHHGASSRIRRLGFVDEQVLPALLRHAQVVAYPSRGEGFGLPVLEALACGAPVVTSSDTVMAEVAGGRARLAPVGDSARLAKELLECLAMSAGQREQHSKAARERAERFTWEVSLDQHMVAYNLARSGE
jgi:glycosyltransferase involved in cell wall biosynthesis